MFNFAAICNGISATPGTSVLKANFYAFFMLQSRVKNPEAKIEPRMYSGRYGMLLWLRVITNPVIQDIRRL